MGVHYDRNTEIESFDIEYKVRWYVVKSDDFDRGNQKVIKSLNLDREDE